jgi:ClpP class serine protease
MRFARIIERVTTQPWMATPGAYKAIVRVLESKLNGERLDFDPDADGDDDNPDYPVAPMLDQNGIASVMISGIMANRIGMLEKMCGGCDYQDLQSLVSQCEEAGAKGFLFQYDSPGGQASGCPEMASFLADIDVPKIAYTDSLMCSAAYFMGSSCDQIFASPTAEVGSIGCIIPWVDESQLWAAAGIKSDPIVSQDSSLKSAFYGPSLTPEQRQHAQDGVDAMMSMFTSHVSMFRDLDYTALQGGAYFGAQALQLGLVDQVGTYADAYNELLGRIQGERLTVG